MKFLLFILMASVHSTLALAEPNINEYGEQCAREIGAELPEINCLDPRGTILKVERRGVPVTTEVQECDKPALLQDEKACVPGTRLIKYTQTVQRGGRSETVITMVLCRRTRGSNLALSSPRFNDVGVIQHNQTNRKTCWFYMLDGAGRDSSRIPRPYVGGRNQFDPEMIRARAFWTSPETTANAAPHPRCIDCHDTGDPFLRTPYVMQAEQDRRPGVNNVIPDHGSGPAIHVEVGGLFKDWNTNPPARIQISEAGYVAALSGANRASYQAARQRGDIAALSTCTRCHTLGSSNHPGAGTCGYIASVSTGQSRTASFLNPHGDPSSRLTPEQRMRLSHWMPLSTNLQTPEAYARYYSPALRALRYCCENPGQPFCHAPAPGAGVTAPASLTAISTDRPAHF